jgi:hypothetical protein
MRKNEWFNYSGGIETRLRGRKKKNEARAKAEKQRRQSSESARVVQSKFGGRTTHSLTDSLTTH